MRLLSVEIIKSYTCGGLLDGLNVNFRESELIQTSSQGVLSFSPLCFLGMNGSGKSQLLQAIVEIFQLIIHKANPSRERKPSNPYIEFNIEYIIFDESNNPIHIRANQQRIKKKLLFSLHKKTNDEFEEITSENYNNFIPDLIVGYTSGQNETLSLPFLVSQRHYAEEVANAARDNQKNSKAIEDTALMFIDYSTNLEVLISNLVMDNQLRSEQILKKLKLDQIHSFRCVIQLNHSAVSTKVILTPELEEYFQNLINCCTCYNYDLNTATYTIDFFVTDATITAFKTFWRNALDLYTSLHKISLLNDLAIRKNIRERFKRDLAKRSFANKLPEPQDEDKVFKFERVRFKTTKQVVDYVSLSDGEHQLAQILGVLSMIGKKNVLFILDEPESHFNPQWRTKFISNVIDLETINGKRKNKENLSSMQEMVITTHSPFLPSDMDRNNIFIFSKDAQNEQIKIFARNPDNQTFGAKFDNILDDCFAIDPPISKLSEDFINTLLDTGSIPQIEEALTQLGQSIQRMKLVARLQMLKVK